MKELLLPVIVCIYFLFFKIYNLLEICESILTALGNLAHSYCPTMILQAKWLNH